ncbi:MAG: 5-formyltetrahydrofolate cyclo-ligase [Gammaproteobacteria bacterium RIFCSPHIGHO2_12_FULL_40_19]|nr:MAG: 5-formyltetrahydrofolate cyclo-ligase [Gammaproteobacteria bacterium RIFCSPHIGHO2_12_FULL_40_19]
MFLDKTELRKSIRHHRKQLSPDAVAQASSVVSEKIMHLPEFSNAKKIASYLPHENEINLAMVASCTEALNKSLYVPILSEKNKLQFYGVDENTQFRKNKWGIEEPIISKDIPVSPHTLDLILIPLVAFDRHRNRLGRGAGCYDRCFAFTKNTPIDKRPVLIGVAYEFQKVDEIISESWDVRMDYIVTEKRVY